ncbi:MAG: AbrB/MazE/SpoVT family DNA-binding domain-containing protein [Gammaproteobacteria bacterium]|nr:AbrB/MazE/SpoVT family DNA-binding domain-containing protein [Gammaproteobacteria bacterium]
MMATLSSKRQITLPKELCDKANIHPGEQFRILEHNGHITLIKQRNNASAGVLQHLKMRADVTDSESRDNTINVGAGPARDF